MKESFNAKKIDYNRETKEVKSLQVVRECIYTAVTILYIDKLLLDRQHTVYIGWDNSILGQPVYY